MGMYGDNYQKNNLYDEMREYVKNNSVSSLLQMVADVVEAKEYMEEEE